MFKIINVTEIIIKYNENPNPPLGREYKKISEIIKRNNNDIVSKKYIGRPHFSYNSYSNVSCSSFCFSSRSFFSSSVIK